MSLAQRLNAVIVSLLEDKAVLMLGQLMNLATIAANVAMRVQDLGEIL